MAQTPLFPSTLFFFGAHVPAKDSETPLCRSDSLLKQMEEQVPDFVAHCERLGVRCSNTMPAVDDPEHGQARSWRSTLGVEDARAAEARLDKLGYSCEWLKDETLRASTPTLPAVRTLVDGKKVFFNQLLAAFDVWKDALKDPSKVICFGDGSPIPVESMQVAIDLTDDLSFDLAWQTGDVALIDNFPVMHCRRPFESQRQVLASLVADYGTRLVA